MTRYAALIRQIGAVVVIVIGAVNGLDLPTGVRAALVAVGGVVMALEHALGAMMNPKTSINVSKLSTPLPTPEPAPASAGASIA